MLKKIFFFDYKNKRSKYEVEKVSIWQHFLISGKHRHTFFLKFVFCSSRIKNDSVTGLVSNFLMLLARGWHFSLQKRKHHNSNHMNKTICLRANLVKNSKSMSTILYCPGKFLNVIINLVTYKVIGYRGNRRINT